MTTDEKLDLILASLDVALAILIDTWCVLQQIAPHFGMRLKMPPELKQWKLTRSQKQEHPEVTDD